MLKEKSFSLALQTISFRILTSLATIFTCHKHGGRFLHEFSEKTIVFVSGEIACDLSISLLLKQSVSADLLNFIICTQIVETSFLKST